MNALSTTQDKSLTINTLTKASALLIIAFFLLSLNSSAQNRSQHPTMIKLNISPVFNGEFGIGLEHKLTKRTSVYGDLSWLDKNQDQIAGKGFGTKAGLRYYMNIKRSYKKGRNKSKMKAFSGSYLSMEGRHGRLAPQSESLSGDFTYQYSKVAVHYGIQRTLKNFFANIEVGPSWGSSDFADIDNRGYYTDGFNLDGRFTIGLAF